MFWVKNNSNWIYKGTLEQCQKMCDDMKLSYNNIYSNVAKLMIEEI